MCPIIFPVYHVDEFLFIYISRTTLVRSLTEESAEACHFELEQLRPARSSVHDLAQRIHAYFANGNVREIAHLDHCSDEGLLPFNCVVSEILCCAPGGVISIERLVGSQQTV